MESNTPPDEHNDGFEYNGIRFYSTTYFNIPCIRSETNYYNFTKIIQEHGYRDIERITRQTFWKDYFNAFARTHRVNNETGVIIRSENDVEGYSRINELNIRFSIMNQHGKRKCLNGTYYPKELLHFLCIHISQEYALLISDEISLIDEEIRKRQLTLEQKLIEQEEYIKSIETRLKNSNSGFNHEHPGAIVIHETSGSHYKLTFKVVNVETSDYPNDVIVSNVYNIDKMKQLILFYTKNNCVDGIQHLGASIFTGSLESILNLIEELQLFKFQPTYNIDELINNHVHNTELAKNNYNLYIGTLFEFYCSKRFNIPIYKMITTEIISLPKQDHGVDLMDIDRKTIAQCKHYSARTLDESKLRTFIDFCKVMTDWNKILYVNKSAKLASNVVNAISNNIFNIVYIEDYEFEAFMDSIGAIRDETSVLEPEIVNENKENETDIENYILELESEKDKWLLSDLLAKVNLKFGLSISQAYFKEHYSHLYAKNRNGKILRDEKTNPIVMRSVANEEEWIKEQVGLAEYIPDELIELHNEHFKTSYNRDSYTRRFGFMFEHNKNRRNELFKRQLDKKQVHLYRFPITDEIKLIFRTFINEHQNLTLMELIKEFNSHFHRYETTVSIKRLMEDTISSEIVDSSTTYPVIRSATDITEEIKNEISDFVSEELKKEDVLLRDMLNKINERYHLSFTSYAFKHIFSSLYRKTYDKSLPKNENGEQVLQALKRD